MDHLQEIVQEIQEDQVRLGSLIAQFWHAGDMNSVRRLEAERAGVVAAIEICLDQL